MDVAEFETRPRGQFSFASAKDHFGGWPEFPAAPDAIAMCFPVEGWHGAAAVIVRERPGGRVAAEVHADDPARAWSQAEAVLSLDVDASGFGEVGRRDPAIGRLQSLYPGLRPVLFHSPYEAACSFVIGQRISIAQTRAIRARMAEESGATVRVGGTTLNAFPSPADLIRLDGIQGVSAEKVERLHGVARAALAGVLDRARLRAMPVDDALRELQEIRGVGPFSAQGTLMRGAGLVDALTDDPVTPQAVQALLGLPEPPSPEKVARMAEAWRPFRMWTLVLLHVWFRRDAGGPRRRSTGSRPGGGPRTTRGRKEPAA
ncbi:MAG: DNA-3-methyladenine glycosylase [Candidatus Limnocylindria bacterium]